MTTEMELGQSQNDGSALMPEITDGKVDARSVHMALKSGTPFDKWFPRRVEEFGFLEGVDFSTDLSGNRHGNRIDYLLTLDMAKELAMVERTEAGRKMRRYFIECEKRLMSGASAAAGLSQLESALVNLAREHDSRIAKLEIHMRPGPDWLGAKAYLATRGIMANTGRLSQFSSECTQRSGALGLPIGRKKNPAGHGAEHRTYSPAVLEAVAETILARWARKEARNEQTPTLPLP